MWPYFSNSRLDVEETECKQQSVTGELELLQSVCIDESEGFQVMGPETIVNSVQVCKQEGIMCYSGGSRKVGLCVIKGEQKGGIMCH